MTITTPVRTTYFTIIFVALIVAVITSVATTIFLYNKLVGTNHTLERVHAQLNEETVQNAEFKNKLLTMTDGAALEAIAQERNLIKATRPHYISAELATRGE